MKAIINKKDGKIVEGRDQLAAIINSAPDGKSIVAVISIADAHTPEEWRKLYFHLRDLIHECVETGYTKKELHSVIKSKILMEMWESKHDEWFIDGDLPDMSTKFLTVTGWKEFIKRLKEFSLDIFEFYI